MLKIITGAFILDRQQGFRKGKSTIINKFVAQQIIRKRSDFNLEMHIAFINFEKHLIERITINYGTFSINSAIQATL